MNSESGNLKHGDITERIIRVFFDVYNELGYGFLEAVYSAAMRHALNEAGLDVESELSIPVNFRGRVIGEYRADLIVGGRVLVELKAARALEPSHEAQVLNYLKATRFEVGLLLNFGPQPTVRRFILDNDRKRPTRAS